MDRFQDTGRRTQEEKQVSACRCIGVSGKNRQLKTLCSDTGLIDLILRLRFNPGPKGFSLNLSLTLRCGLEMTKLPALSKQQCVEGRTLR